MSLTPEEELITEFYTAFKEKDAEKMASLYAADATFEDPAFKLKGEDCGMMWKMLVSQGKDLEVTFSNVKGSNGNATAHWEAKYTFGGKNGRKVHNKIEATFTIQDGKIKTHKDVFNFWSWSSQALGPLGLFLGWTPFVHSQVKAQAMKGLAKFKAKQEQET